MIKSRNKITANSVEIVINLLPGSGVIFTENGSIVDFLNKYELIKIDA